MSCRETQPYAPRTTKNTATTNSIKLAARRFELSMAEADVASVILFWCQGQDGGVRRDGHRWTYRNATEIAGQTGQSTRAVERALKSLREKGVIASEAWRRPDRPGERVNHFRPLEKGREIISAAHQIEADRRTGASRSRGTAASAVSEPPVRRDGSRHPGGLIKQTNIQTDSQDNQEEISSPSATTKLASNFFPEQSGGEEAARASEMVKEERERARETALAYNRVLREFDLPPVSFCTTHEINALLKFRDAVDASDYDLDSFVGILVRLWAIIKPMLPDSAGDYQGNELRPNSLALGMYAAKLSRVVPLVHRLDAVGAASEAAAIIAYDDKSMIAVASLGLLTAARKFLTDKGTLFALNGWGTVEASIRKAFESRKLEWPYGEDDRSTAIIMQALKDADFMPWASLNVENFLPVYRARDKARSRSLRARDKAHEASCAGSDDAPQLAANARKAYEAAQAIPSNEQVQERCVELWNTYSNLVQGNHRGKSKANHSDNSGGDENAALEDYVDDQYSYV